MSAVGLALVLIVALIGVFSPLVSLFGYWVMFLVRPWEWSPLFGGNFYYERIMGMAMIGAFILHYKILKNKPLVTAPMTKALIGFLLANYLSVWNPIWPGGALEQANEFVRTVMVFFVTVNVLDSESRLRKFAWLYVSAIGWFGATTVYNYLTNPYFAQGIQRATSLIETWKSPNAVSGNLAMCVPVVWALAAVEKRKLARLLLLGLLGIFFSGIILSASRQGFVILLALFFMMVLFSRRRAVVIPVLVVVVCVGVFLIPSSYLERYETIIEFAQDTSYDLETAEGLSAHARILTINVAVQVFLDHPLMGVGAGNFAAAWLNPDTPYSYHGMKKWQQAHNLLGQVLSELGLMGALTFGAYVFLMWQKNGLNYKALMGLEEPSDFLVRMTLAVRMIVTTLFIAGITSHNVYRYNWYLAGVFTLVVGRLAMEMEKNAVAVGSPVPAVARSFAPAPRPAVASRQNVTRPA